MRIMASQSTNNVGSIKLPSGWYTSKKRILRVHSQGLMQKK